MISENLQTSKEKKIKHINVFFKGVNHTNPEYLNLYKKSLQNEINIDKILQKVDLIQQELLSLNVFSSVIPSIKINEDESTIDIEYKLRENKLNYTLGSTINKQGKIGFEASAFIPNIFGTLSTTKLSLETFGSKSKEFNLTLFTPKILLSNINMTYNLFRSVIDYNRTSSYIDNSFGGTVKFSTQTGNHNLNIESKFRNTPVILKEYNSSNYEENNKSITTLKNSICYSWNNRIKEEKSLFDNQINEKKDYKKVSFFKNNFQQFSLEYAGFNGDAQFIKLQNFQNWNMRLSKYFNKLNFLEKINLDLNLGFGILLPNSIRNKNSFKTTINDRFFIGGNFGFHNCLMGFASRSIGPCIPRNIKCKDPKDNSNEIKYDYIGSDGFASAELNFSYPLDLEKFGMSIKPKLLTYVSNAIILDEKSDISYEKYKNKNFLHNFRENMRASTGIGISIPLNFANLSLLFSIPLKHKSTDLTENIQLGMRMTYLPL